MTAESHEMMPRALVTTDEKVWSPLSVNELRSVRLLKLQIPCQQTGSATKVCCDGDMAVKQTGRIDVG